MIHSWGITDKGVVRAQNQDSYYLKPINDSLVTAMVCDGMGGAKAGNVASSLAVEAASAYLQSLSADELADKPGESLSRAAELANEAVCLRAVQDENCWGMGTTMVAVIAAGEQLTILNVGDSRAYLISEEGITKVTRDHSVVEDMVHRGELTPVEARNHPHKNLITRALGAEPAVRVDLYHVQWKPGDFLLLCSDGLSNPLTDQELLYEVLYGGTPESCCQRMLDVAISKGAPDNVTAVLLQMTEGRE